MSVMTSSLVGWMMKSRSCRSFTRSSSGPILSKRPGLLPQLGGLHHRHQQLDGAGAVHLLADDAARPCGSRAGPSACSCRCPRPALDQAGAHHQLVAGDPASAGASFRVETKNWVDLEKAPGRGCGPPGATGPSTPMHNEFELAQFGLIMLDREGFQTQRRHHPAQSENQVFWGKRLRTHSWQFPQGHQTRRDA